MADILVYSDSLSTAKEPAFKGREFAAPGNGDLCCSAGRGCRRWATQLGAFGADRVFVSKDAALEGLQTDAGRRLGSDRQGSRCHLHHDRLHPPCKESRAWHKTRRRRQTDVNL